ncbi:hypothetical protein K488DRAFT_88591 [Vararia minispora EC-137]|uniref:Uncharacterized protein n=1 Tax=Vararia minispora EC-137 TaxID=1314806 RepID=A0ACB8QCX7_9AGAM|nr:hypothetical protein K488DRAFT_88591 [Vararia minispora EC-137]
MSSGNTLAITWSNQGLQDLKSLDPEDYDSNPKKWHEDKVAAFQKAQSALASANRAKIRRAAHTGGTDPNEKDHITVSYRQNNKEINSPRGGGWHVYTGR